MVATNASSAPGAQTCRALLSAYRRSPRPRTRSAAHFRPSMPPRRPLVATSRNKGRDALTVLPLALPMPLALRIWGALPCDVLLRCRAVCRAWRDALAEPRLWLEVDLTTSSGIVARITPALLRAVAALARGQMKRLFVTHADMLDAALLGLVAANANTLRLLRLERGGHCYYRTYTALANLLRTTLQHCVVEVDASFSYVDAGNRLRNELPFENLRLRSLDISGRGMHAADVAALATDMAAHPSLCELHLSDVPLDTFAALGAIVDAALALRLTKLSLVHCGVTPASAAALPRLLHVSGALCELHVHNGRLELLDAHVASLLADTLRSNRTLTSLRLFDVGLWHNMDAAAEFFAALVGHASLTSIRLGADFIRGNDAPKAGALLAALVAANTPQLRVLDVSQNFLGDAGLRPLVSALPHNTHLRQLSCWNNTTSAAFVRKRLMPALASNASLRTLYSNDKTADDFIAARTGRGRRFPAARNAPTLVHNR